MLLSKAPRYLLLTFIFLGSVRTGITRITLLPTSSYCTRLTDTLDCNFKGTEESVILDSFSEAAGKEITEIFIRNVKQLTVTGTICVKLHLDAVNKAIFSRPHICQETENLSLWVTNSYLNLVPKYITKLNVEDSTVEELICDKHLQSLSIVKSQVRTLAINQPISGALVKIEHSSIETLEKLWLEGRAQLHMVNTTIHNLMTDSLQIEDSTVNILQSNILSSEDEAVIVGVKANVVLENIAGKITFSGPEEMRTSVDAAMDSQHRQPPHKRRPNKSNNSSPYVWIIPTIVAVIELMIIMVNCTVWFPGLKSVRRRRELEQGARFLQRPNAQTEQASAYSYHGMNSQSSVYYSSDAFDTSSLNKRQKSN